MNIKKETLWMIECELCGNSAIESDATIMESYDNPEDYFADNGWIYLNNELTTCPSCDATFKLITERHKKKELN